MINPLFIELALEKVAEPDAREQLQRIKHLALELAASELAFPERLAANRRERGEKPTVLSKSQQAALSDIDEDIALNDRESLKMFKDAANAREILEAVTFELPGAPKDWSWMLPHAHLEDRADIEQVVALQRSLDEAITRFLESYPDV